MKKKFLTILVLLFSVSLVFADYSWNSEMVTKNLKKDKVQSKVKLLYRATDDVLRMDFLELEGRQQKQAYDKNVYWLYKGDSVHIVNSKEKKYTTMSLDSLLQMSAMTGKVVKLDIEDYTLNKEDLGSEEINSYKCKHLKLNKKYTMKMKVAFIKQTMKMESEQELWITNDISFGNKGFLNKTYKTGFDGLDKMIEKEMSVYGKSFIMKSVEKVITRNKKGKVQSENLTTTTVSNVKKENFNNALFEIPKDYEHAPMFGLNPEDFEVDEDSPQEDTKDKKKKKKKKMFKLF